MQSRSPHVFPDMRRECTAAVCEPRVCGERHGGAGRNVRCLCALTVRGDGRLGFGEFCTAFHSMFGDPPQSKV